MAALEDVGYGRPLFVPLATVPFRAFERGEKTVEVRQDAPRWRGVVPGRPVLLRRGYSTPDQLARFVGRVHRGYWSVAPEWVRQGAALPADSKRYFDLSRRIIAFECLPAEGGSGP